MMTKISKIYLYILVAVVCLWQLPWLFNFLTATPEERPFILYSSAIKDFAIRKNESGKTVYVDLNGNTYSKHQYDLLLPEYFARQLAADKSLPDTLFGQPVDLKLLTDENLTLRIKPETVFGPYIPLYQMFESQSGNVDLEMPPDVFRLDDTKMEFINKADNTLNAEKSADFTNELKKVGFEFPVVDVAGNVSEKKKYDNGYLFTDSEGCLFNVKMEQGRPVVRKIELPNGVVPTHCFVTEFIGRHSLGVFFDAAGQFYVITQPYNKIVKTELPPVDLGKGDFFVMGNMFTWTVRVTDEEKITWYAIDANNFSLLKKYYIPLSDSHLGGLSFLKNGWVRVNWK